jgi:uncharacterized membrane protein YfhO
MILAIYALLGLYPFGGHSIMKSDLFHSYGPQYDDFLRSIKEGGDIWYTWSGAMGQANLGSIITIASSPLNLLMLLFNIKGTDTFFAVLMLLKIPFGAAFFYIYIREKFNKEGIINVVISAAYGLCAYASVYHWNIMWLDSMIIFPLIILGLDRVLDGKGAKLYCLALVYAIITSYGTAWQICVFALIYFITMFFLRPSVKKLAAIRRFAIYSVVAAGMCAIYIMPTMFGLVDSNYARYMSMPDIKFYTYPTKYLAAMLWGAQPTNMVFSESTPNLYVGVFALLLAPFYFLSKGIKLKEKIASGILLVVLFLCFDVNVLTFIMHGLHFPSMMPHRYSYMWSFVLAVMAVRAFTVSRDFKYRTYIIVAVVAEALLVGIYLLHPQNVEFPKPGRLALTGLFVNAALVIAYTALPVLSKKFNSTTVRRILAGAFCAICVFEVTSSGLKSFKSMGDAAIGGYVQDMYDSMQQVTQVLNEEPEFYRAEFKHFRTMSDGRIYGYNGINSFAGLNAPLMDFFDAIGATSSQNVVVWTNPTPVLMSWFSQKYLFNKGRWSEEFAKKFTTFNYKFEVDDIYVYENPNVLPVGFMVDERLADWDIGKYRFGNPFDAQDDMVSVALGGALDGRIFSDFTFERESIETEFLSVVVGENGHMAYTIPEDITVDDIPLITLRFVAPESKWTYISLRVGSGATYADVLINGKEVLGQSTRSPATPLDCGFVNAGDEITLKIKVNGRNRDEEAELIRYGDITVFAAQMDENLFHEMVNTLSEHTLKVTYYDDSHITGTVSVDKEGLLWTSIPVDAGWNIKVDGKLVLPRLVANTFYALKLFPGEHTIEFAYRPNFQKGGIISLIFVALFIGMWIYDRNRKMQKLFAEENSLEQDEVSRVDTTTVADYENSEESDEVSESEE